MGRDKDRINSLLKEAGWNWMSSSERYINIEEHHTEPRYWIAPFARLDDVAVEAKYSRCFNNLQEIKIFLQEKIRQNKEAEEEDTTEAYLVKRVYIVVQRGARPPYRPEGARMYDDAPNAQRRKRQLNEAARNIDKMIARDGAIIIL